MLSLARFASFALPIGLLAACTPAAPAPPETAATTSTPARFEPAPLPSVHPVRRAGTVGAYEIVIPPKAPPGTGAVPVNGGPFRGSIVTGIKESF